MQNTHIIGWALIGLSVLSVSCAGGRHTSKHRMAGTWQTQPIVVDGANQDWPSPYPNYDADAMVGYATSNDKDNLYITMETGDEYTQMKILKAGMTVWIDTTGGRNTGLGIHYPMQAGEINPLEVGAREGRPAQGRNSDLGKSNMAAKVKKSIDDANQLSLEGFTKCSGGFLTEQKNDCGISVRIGMDEYGELIWEAVVPFKALYHKDHITAQDAAKPISVCFAIKGFKRTASNSGGGDQGTEMGSMGNMRGGMGSGMGGGGMRGGGMRGGGGRGAATTNPKEKLFESSKTWKEFSLVYE